MELLPPDARSKYQAKPADRSKRAKKEETKGSAQQVEDTQVLQILVDSRNQDFKVQKTISKK